MFILLFIHLFIYWFIICILLKYVLYFSKELFVYIFSYVYSNTNNHNRLEWAVCEKDSSVTIFSVNWMLIVTCRTFHEFLSEQILWRFLMRMWLESPSLFHRNIWGITIGMFLFYQCIRKNSLVSSIFCSDWQYPSQKDSSL